MGQNCDKKHGGEDLGGSKQEGEKEGEKGEAKTLMVRLRVVVFSAEQQYNTY